LTLPRRAPELRHAWLHVTATQDSTANSIRDIRDGLTGCGIFICGLEKARHGILVFSELDDQLLQSIAEIQYRTRGYILTLAVSPSALNRNDVSRLLQAGAADVLTWEDSAVVAAQIRAKLDRWHRIDELMDDASRRGLLIGSSLLWTSLMRRIIEAAHFSTAPVLLIGESGTGKELIARFIHLLSREQGSEWDLVTVDCGAIIPDLSGSELFGHERGAFTGAVADRDGAFALAAGRTLFLDEIGDLPLALQPQLLRAIQEKTYKRVGSNHWQTIDFRLISATNRDLNDLVERGQFRLDLYHRISSWVFNVPPLRNRGDDILPLANHFLASACPREEPVEFDLSLRDYLLNRSYPGNVRELRQLIDRIAERHVGPGRITLGDVPEEDRLRDTLLECQWPDESLETTIERAIALGVGLKHIRQVATETSIRIALRAEDGNLQRAARRLGVTDRALQMRRASGKISMRRAAA